MLAKFQKRINLNHLILPSGYLHIYSYTKILIPLSRFVRPVLLCTAHILTGNLNAIYMGILVKL